VSGQQAAPGKLQTGTWTGTVTPPNEGAIEASFDVAYRGDTLTITLRLAQVGTVPLQEARVADGVLRFYLPTPAERIACELKVMPGGVYQGNCQDSRSESGTIVMAPPGTRPPAPPAAAAPPTTPPANARRGPTYLNSLPMFSPDGKRIAFVSNRDGQAGELYVVNADGTGERRLTNTPDAEAMPVWSGDGRRLLYRVGSPRNPDVRTIDVETGEITRLDVADGTPLAINRRGSAVVTKGLFPSATLHVRPSGGGNDTPISPTEGVAFWPTWSRSGTHVAFTYLLPNLTDPSKTRLRIAVAAANGTGFRTVTPDSVRAETPAWFPDGRRIAFQASTNGNYDIWLVNVDGSGVRRLTRSPHLEEVPSISPDGKTIVFQSDRDGPVDLWLMDVDGSNIRKLIR
jgi:TolB protein